MLLSKWDIALINNKIWKINWDGMHIQRQPNDSIVRWVKLIRIVYFNLIIFLNILSDDFS